MFLMIGINDDRKELVHNQTVVCMECGKYTRLQVFVTYTVFSLFFIPLFKWNKQYYVQTGCCNTLYELDPWIGKRIARGDSVDIRQSDLHKINSGYSQGFGKAGGYQNGYGQNGGRGQIKRCPNCGYTTNEDFDYCPKCGNRL